MKDVSKLHEALEALDVGPIGAVTVELDRVYIRLDDMANEMEAARVWECVRTLFPDHGISVLGGRGTAKALMST